MTNFIFKDCGILVGLSCIPQYSEFAFNFTKFIDETLNPIFSGYKLNLVKNLSSQDIDPNLYSPIHFYAFGHFNIISLSLIDDFYFGNFHFRSNNKNTQSSIPNFQYQTVNCFNSKTRINLNNFQELKKFNYVGVSKIKVKPTLILNHGYRIISFIKQLILQNSKNDDVCTIISDSHSWHDLTIIYFSDSLEFINSEILDTRKFSTFHLKDFDNEFMDYSQIKHIFVDTHTTFGINPDLFDMDSRRFLAYTKSNLDTKLNTFSKIHIKTGHGEIFRKLIIQHIGHDSINYDIRFIDGRSDHIIYFNSINSFISFWNCMQKLILNSEINDSNPLYHIRKIHSNISFKLPELSENESDYNIDLHLNLFKQIKFKHQDLIQIESNLKKLKVSKEQSNSVISAFTNFNDLITDVNLFSYFLDTYPLLHTLKILLHDYSNLNNSDIPNKKVNDVSDLINTFLGIWQNSFLNRFQESKRYEYNSDSKTEFNGGVHQILETYDSIYKLVIHVSSLIISKDIIFNLPLTTYGNQKVGIKSTIYNLQINYFQLFQPEFFLFVLRKEALNHQFDRFKLDKNSKFYNETIGKISDFKNILPNLIHNEPDIKCKKILYDYCEPSSISTRVRYIVTYSNWFSTMFHDEFELFVFWYWGTFFQLSENYNTDGSLKVDMLKRTLFDFALSMRIVGNEITLEKLTDIIKCKVFKFLLLNLLQNCIFSINYISTKTKFVDDLLLMTGRLTMLNRSLEQSPEASLVTELNAITIEYLKGLKDEFTVNAGEQFVCFRRKDGLIVYSPLYSVAVFDPNGGIFIREPKLRKLYFRRRIDLLLELKEIALKFKKHFSRSIIE